MCILAPAVPVTALERTVLMDAACGLTLPSRSPESQTALPFSEAVVLETLPRGEP